MTYASKTTFCFNNLKILRPKVTKILQIGLKNLCEFPHKLVEWSTETSNTLRMDQNLAQKDVAKSSI